MGLICRFGKKNFYLYFGSKGATRHNHCPAYYNYNDDDDVEWMMYSLITVIIALGSDDQCDQMGWLYFNIWPFSTVKLWPIAIFCQNGFKILPNTKTAFEKLPKTFILFSQNGKFSPNLVTLDCRRRNLSNCSPQTDRPTDLLGSSLPPFPFIGQHF